MERYGNFNYSSLTGAGFLLGVGLLALGAGGELVGHAFYAPLPSWEEAVFFYSEVIGVLIALFTPFVFGIFLPLTE